MLQKFSTFLERWYHCHISFVRRNQIRILRLFAMKSNVLKDSHPLEPNATLSLTPYIPRSLLAVQNVHNNM